MSLCLAPCWHHQCIATEIPSFVASGVVSVPDPAAIEKVEVLTLNQN